MSKRKQQGSSSEQSSKRKSSKQSSKHQLSLLDQLPSRDSTLCQHALVHDLSPTLKLLLKQWLLTSFPHSPEIATVLMEHVAVHNPTHLRVKELFETIEVVKHAGNHIQELKPKPKVVYDLACGHGLGGVLLGYRFPSLQIVCVDREKRDCFASYMEAFKVHGEGADLSNNVTFKEGEVQGNKIAGEVVQGNSYHMCIHGCNEMSVIALDIAKATQSGYTVVPCCIRDNVFGVRTKSSGGRWSFGSDDIRYAVQVGYLGGKVCCDRIATIDRRITNRNLVVLGDFIATVEDEDVAANGVAALAATVQPAVVPLPIVPTKE